MAHFSLKQTWHHLAEAADDRAVLPAHLIRPLPATAGLPTAGRTVDLNKKDHGKRKGKEGAHVGRTASWQKMFLVFQFLFKEFGLKQIAADMICFQPNVSDYAFHV